MRLRDHSGNYVTFIFFVCSMHARVGGLHRIERHSQAELVFHEGTPEVKFEVSPLPGFKGLELAIWLRQSQDPPPDQFSDVSVCFPSQKKIFVPALRETSMASIRVQQRVNAMSSSSLVAVNNRTRKHELSDFDFAMESFSVTGRYSAVSRIVLSYIGPENITTRHVAWDFRNLSWHGVNFSETVTAIRVQTRANPQWIDGKHVRGVQWYKARDNSALLRLNQYQAEANLYMDGKDSYYHDDRVETCAVVTQDVELKFECNPGEGYEEGQCNPCAAGKFKKEFANTQCNNCPEGLGTVSTGQKICSECLPGTQLQERVCTLCPTGKFRPSSFHSKQQCQDCEAGKYLDKRGSTTEQDCALCYPGKYLPFSGASSAAECLDCLEGSYSNDMRAQCANCTENKTTVGVGSVSEQDCVCRAGYEAGQGVACDSCAAGKYSTRNGTCTDCDAGLYQPSISGTACELCGFENFSASGAASCTSCPSHSTGKYKNNTEYSDCLCKPGFTGISHDSNGCQACDAGKFKANLGSETCKPCDAGSFQNRTTSSACIPCHPHHWSHENAIKCQKCLAENTGGLNLTSWSDCECLPGFHAIIYNNTNLKNTTKCEACDAGKFKQQFGYDKNCSYCDIGKYSETLNATKETTCRNCDKNEYSAAGSSSCLHCVDFSESINKYGNESDCKCKQGYSFSTDPKRCIGCSPGSFKQTISNDACEECPAGTSLAFGNATHRDNCTACTLQQFSQKGSAQCIECPLHSQTIGLQALVTDCLCLPGFTAPDAGHGCSKCAAGKFKEGTRTGVCVNCGKGKFSEKSGATSAGHCVSCPEAKFAPAGSDACTECESFSDSWGERAARTDCKCNRGYRGEDGGTCTACQRGKYKLRIGNWPCILCPDGKYSDKFNASKAEECRLIPKHAHTTLSQASFECDDNYDQSMLHGEIRCIPTGKFDIATAV